MGDLWQFVNTDLGLVLVGAIAGALLSSVGWIIKLISDRRRDRLEFVRARCEARARGYDKFMAAANALQYIKASGHLTHQSKAEGFRELFIRALALSEDAASEIRSNMVETEPFDKVVDYYLWLFYVDHPPMQEPGVSEFDKLRDLLVKCERVALRNEKSAVLKINYRLSDDHEHKALLAGANQRYMSTDGEVLLTFSDGNPLADWIEGIPEQSEMWRASKDLSRLQMERSGFFGADLPAR